MYLLHKKVDLLDYYGGINVKATQHCFKLFIQTLLCTQTDVLGRWSAQEEKESHLLSRPDGSRLFQNLTRGNRYLVQAEGYLNSSASGQTSEMALTWNRTAIPGGSVRAFS